MAGARQDGSRAPPVNFRVGPIVYTIQNTAVDLVQCACVVDDIGVSVFLLLVYFWATPAAALSAGEYICIGSICMTGCA